MNGGTYLVRLTVVEVSVSSLCAKDEESAD